MGRLLGIDWGEKRVGLALSDIGKVFAQPFLTLNNDENLLEKLQKVCVDKGVERIVVGLPVRTDGRIGRSEEIVREFARELEEKTGLTVILWDERFSSVVASYYTSSLKEIDSRKIKDKVEASVILQSYLESVRP
ncbi:MAG: Holliday junction resolvase RuvX [Synergistetes bacterium]|nr:Holliday junction resolvase RuvX [Synergistota bacterium]